MYEFLALPLAYILGSFPSSVIVARLFFNDKKFQEEIQNGHLGTSSLKKRYGLISGILVGALDFLKGFMSIFIADKLGGDDIILVLSGVLAIIGHNWSCFLKLKGGKGAACSYGNLFYLLPREFIISLFLTALPTFFVNKFFQYKNKIGKMRKTTFLTFILYLFTLTMALFFNQPIIIAFSPILFSIPIVLKNN